MTRKFCVGLSCCCAVLLSSRAGQCQTNIGFVSNVTWNAFALYPDGNQGASLGLAQCENWNAYGTDVSAIAGACWLWIPGVDANSPSDLQGGYFSKRFNLAGTPIGGYIQIAVDDFAEVLVNGSVVGTTGSISDYNAAALGQSALVTFDISPYLVGGFNTITIKAQNGPSAFAGGRCGPCTYGGNQAGVVFGGTMQFDNTTSVKRATWSDLKAQYR